MFKSTKRLVLSTATVVATITLSGASFAQMTPGEKLAAPSPDKVVPAPNFDTNGDGKPDAWDKDGDGKPDAWDKNGDGKPDEKTVKPKAL